MVHQAAQNPDAGIIGCEPFINGVAMLLGKIRQAGVRTCASIPAMCATSSTCCPTLRSRAASCSIPIPGRRRRHHRRRFVTPEHLEPLARVMKPGAVLRVATDIPDYVRQTLEQVPRHGFDWLADGPADWRAPWDDWLSTRYEQKALREGRVPHYLTFRRR